LTTTLTLDDSLRVLLDKVLSPEPGRHSTVVPDLTAAEDLLAALESTGVLTAEAELLPCGWVRVNWVRE
jgi:hypothetical protein